MRESDRGEHYPRSSNYDSNEGDKKEFIDKSQANLNSYQNINLIENASQVEPLIFQSTHATNISSLGNSAAFMPKQQPVHEIAAVKQSASARDLKDIASDNKSNLVRLRSCTGGKVKSKRGKKTNYVVISRNNKNLDMQNWNSTQAQINELKRAVNSNSFGSAHRRIRIMRRSQQQLSNSDDASEIKDTTAMHS